MKRWNMRGSIPVAWFGKQDTHIRGLFEKFMDSPFHSESELCEGTVTVSFSKFLPWQAMHFLQSPTHFSKTCWRQLISSKFLASELPFHGLKSPVNAWGKIWTVWRMFQWGSTDPLFPSRTQNSIQISGLFQPWKGSSEARNFEVINGLQHVFELGVERCKKCIACQGRYFENRHRTSTNFRLGVIRLVNELCKRPSYI
jgi:hypothetical protein